MGLDGRPPGAARRVDCRAGLVAELPAGKNLVLTGADQGTPLVLRDLLSGARHRLRWPARPEYLLAEVSPAPDGRQAVVGFARYSPAHRPDLWLLDLATRR